MKIIHSFWSKPAFNGGFNDPENRTFGGWFSQHYFYTSWALSCLQARKFYNKVELVTDTLGKEILVDFLKLPYTEVSTSLDSISFYNSGLWAIPKIYAFKEQKEPFIHIDGDVFIWGKLNINYESPLIAQSEEINLRGDTKMRNFVFENFKYIPESFVYDRENMTHISSYNAGIIGGSDLLFFKNFVEESLLFINKNNINSFEGILGEMGLMYEQYLFSCLSRYNKIHVETLFKQKIKNFGDLIPFHMVPNHCKYIHVSGAAAKKNTYICESMEKLLKYQYPKYHRRILSMLQ